MSTKLAIIIAHANGESNLTEKLVAPVSEHALRQHIMVISFLEREG